MAAADVIVCRAGAMTLSELALTEKPAVLVPYPYAAENHQYKNAKVLSDSGAAILIADSELDEEKIENAVNKILYTENAAEDMAKSIKKFAMPKANEDIYKKLIELIKK
jgi:UDP-N-acetylglucosamine--N-acetylmuramyl-(pentapeptide) pyrophosphoryl-undecaprenol N-acetylglucosamine transferase